MMTIKKHGSIMPSAPMLIDKMLSHVNFDAVDVFVEFGFGNGCFTREILKRLKPSGQLLSFEIDTEFCNDACKIKDSRFSVLQIGAERVTEVLKQYSIEKADCILSSLPFAQFPRSLVNEALTQSKKVLSPGALYLQYQY